MGRNLFAGISLSTCEQRKKALGIEVAQCFSLSRESRGSVPGEASLAATGVQI